MGIFIRFNPNFIPQVGIYPQIYIFSGNIYSSGKMWTILLHFIQPSGNIHPIYTPFYIISGNIYPSGNNYMFLTPFIPPSGNIYPIYARIYIVSGNVGEGRWGDAPPEVFKRYFNSTPSTFKTLPSTFKGSPQWCFKRCFMRPIRYLWGLYMPHLWGLWEGSKPQ